jgi:hypothetical protein
MTLDRRELVTGVAATTSLQGFGWQAAAASVFEGASFKGRRFYFTEGLLFSDSVPWSHACYEAHWSARWHLDPNPKGHALVQHEDSGLAFRLARQPDDPFAMEAVFIDVPPDGWPAAAMMAAVGRAASWAFLRGQNLRYWQRRTGAFYFWFRELPSAPDYRGPHVEDAPALF